jgi:hypothetical protein
MRSLLIGLILALAGCQQLPLTPEDIQARKFEAVPDKAVIYVVRDNPDFSGIQAQIDLDDSVKLMTYEGTYYRWEVAPGTHRVRGFGGDMGSISVQVERGKIYFVQARVAGRFQAETAFQLVTEAEGKAAVLRSVLIRPRQAAINE